LQADRLANAAVSSSQTFEKTGLAALRASSYFPIEKLLRSVDKYGRFVTL